MEGKKNKEYNIMYDLTEWNELETKQFACVCLFWVYVWLGNACRVDSVFRSRLSWFCVDFYLSAPKNCAFVYAL